MVAGVDVEYLLEPTMTRRLTGLLATGDHAQRETVMSPLTGEPLADVPLSVDDDVVAAIHRGRSAQRIWAKRAARERASVILAFHDLLLECREDVLDLIQAETGKTRLHAYEEIAEVANVARYYARTAGRLLASRRAHGVLPMFGHATEHRQPWGVVGVVTPWNYPFALSLGDSIAALLAGNAVVLRPDQRTALSVLRGVELLSRAGLPAGVLQVVTGGPDIGESVVRHADYISFTGSTATGRRVARIAADRLIGVSLELGGKNALYVRADANLDLAVDVALRSCFSAAGQLCVHTERLLLHRSIAEEFLDRFVPAVEGLQLGVGLEYGPDMGTLLGADQLERVVRQVEDAKARGARVRTGGTARPDIAPFAYAPTVMDEVTAAMDLRDSETFGPVVSVFWVDDDDIAVRLINDSDYGLHATLVTADLPLARCLATRIRTGSLSINETYAASWGAVGSSIGGMKDSGIGGRHGPSGLTRFTQLQSVAEHHGLPLRPWGHQSQEQFAAVMSRGLAVIRRLGIR